MDDLIGKGFGPYKILDKIGEGGMAVVYKAYQESLGRYAAIKVLRAELARDEEFVARFRREALAVARLNHPNILHVYDAGVANGVYYMAMGFVDGGSLKDLIGQGPVEPAYAASIGAQLADALDYAHKQGIVHRDVKPSNVLMTRDGRPMLTDFGIAKALYESAALTRTGISIGTPEYMAPEQIQGQPVDGRTDIYALGIVLYEMVTGWAPFSTPTPVATLYKQVNEPPPPLHQVNVNVPDWLEGVVGKALAKRPEGRYQQAADLAAALRSRGAGAAPIVSAGIAPAPAATEGRPSQKAAEPRRSEGAVAASKAAPAPVPAKPATGGSERAVTPPAGVPVQETRQKRGKAVPILIAAIALLVVALAAGGAYLAFGGKGDKGQGAAWVTQVVTSAPTDAGIVTVVVVPGETAATAVPAEVLASPTTQTIVVVASSTPEPPTATPELPTSTPEPPAATATEKPAVPTDTPAPTAVQATAAPTATKKPAGSLASYGLVYSNFSGGSEADATKYTVWIVRGDGSSAAKIIDTATMPAYSPNGQKIAYYKTFEGIAVYDLNKKSTTLAVPNNWAEFASFSPDGKQLVFHEWVGNWYSADVSLYVVNSDGSGRYKLVPGERPVWSPKGDLIAFDSCQGNDCGIFVVKPNGQGMRQVTKDAGGNAAWSPDGKKIAYCSSADGDSEIWIVNLDGSGVKQLTKNTGNDTNPAFSPDGSYIFYLSDQNGKAWALRVMRPDGSDIKTLRQVGTAPRWQFARMWAGWW